FLIATLHLTAFSFPSVLWAEMPVPLMEKPSIHKELHSQSVGIEQVASPSTAKPSVVDSEFVRVPTGDFVMGCSPGEGCSDVEAPPQFVQSPLKRASFEVASIKANKSGVAPSSMGIGPAGPASGPM